MYKNAKPVTCTRRIFVFSIDFGFDLNKRMFVDYGLDLKKRMFSEPKKVFRAFCRVFCVKC